MEANDHWIFYLKLTRDLPREYIRLDHEFKKSNKSLIPVTMKGLLDFVSRKKKIHVLIVVRSRKELAYYHKKVTKILKYSNLLKDESEVPLYRDRWQNSFEYDILDLRVPPHHHPPKERET